MSEQEDLFIKKRTIRIGGSISGVIATGSWENLRPHFTWEETIEDFTGTDEQVMNRIKSLHEKAMVMMKDAEIQATVERIRRERKDLRILISPYTKKPLPSVTSIINYDTDFFCSPEELAQYASQGNIIDARVKHYIKIGKWSQASEIKEVWTDIVILTKGDMKLETDVGDFPAMLEKYPIDKMKVGERFFNDDLGYCGEPDFSGIPEKSDDWEKIGGKPIQTIFDVKRTPSKLKNGMQLAAYCKNYGIVQGIIIPLSDKTKQGYSKPVVYDKEKLDGYFSVFQNKQKEFKKRYNI